MNLTCYLPMSYANHLTKNFDQRNQITQCQG